MKNKVKLAFEMLEQEMEVITSKNQSEITGGIWYTYQGQEYDWFLGGAQMPAQFIIDNIYKHDKNVASWNYTTMFGKVIDMNSYSMDSSGSFHKESTDGGKTFVKVYDTRTYTGSNGSGTPDYEYAAINSTGVAFSVSEFVTDIGTGNLQYVLMSGYGDSFYYHIDTGAHISLSQMQANSSSYDFTTLSQPIFDPLSVGNVIIKKQVGSTVTYTNARAGAFDVNADTVIVNGLTDLNGNGVMDAWSGDAVGFKSLDIYYMQMYQQYRSQVGPTNSLGIDFDQDGKVYFTGGSTGSSGSSGGDVLVDSTGSISQYQDNEGVNWNNFFYYDNTDAQYSFGTGGINGNGTSEFTGYSTGYKNMDTGEIIAEISDAHLYTSTGGSTGGGSTGE